MQTAKTYATAGILALALGCTAIGPGASAGEDATGRVTVSGISAGAYMATQVHLALSSTVDGAASLAGGPYHCAEGNLAKALGPCIKGTDLQAEPLIAAARQLADSDTIDPVGPMGDDRVWLFLGQHDPVVAVAVMQAAHDFYSAFLPEQSIEWVDTIPASHGWPTTDKGVACTEFGGDFIIACDYDAAGALLQHLYGTLSPPVAARDEGLVTLDQASLVPEGGSFAETGFAYVPESCAGAPTECRLHLAFHGCRQGSEFIEDRFARMSGLNEWAESNGIVVLYPQVNASEVNPQGCWDWWGYTGSDYDQRTGKQVAGVAALIEAWSP